MDYLVQQSMLVYENRLATFAGWPYTEKENMTCTAEKLASSGFYRPSPESEPELACCFMCLKDLEGWEPDDIPDEEHKSHSPACPYIQLKIRNRDEMHVYDYVKMHYQQYIILCKKQSEKLVAELKKKHSAFREELSEVCS